EPLVPEGACLPERWRRQLARPPADRQRGEPRDTLRVERGQHIADAGAPVVADNRELVEAEGVGKVDSILRQGGNLARPHRPRGAEPLTAVAAQPWRIGPEAGLVQRS